MDARGYPGDQASAAAAPPPPDSFTRVYHFSGAAFAFDNIQKRRLKVATLKDTNDPFELSVFLSTDPDQQRRLKEFIDHVCRTYGIVCFSEEWKDPVLWSHYADKHRGVALGFDISDSHLLWPAPGSVDAHLS
jgi:hypothetical protein